MRGTCISSSAAALTAMLGLQLQAQQTQAALSITGGSATDVAGVTSHAFSLMPSLTLTPDPRAVFAVDGSLTRFGDQGWAAGGGIGSALRAPVGSFAALTFNGGVAGTRTSYDFSYATASALPALELSRGPLSAYAGVHLAASATRLTSTSRTPVPGGLFGGGPSPAATPVTTAISRSGRTYVVGGNARITTIVGASLVGGVRQEQGTIDTIATVDRSASVSFSRGPISIDGTLGVRTEPALRSTFGSASMSVAVNPAVSVQVQTGAYPADRLVATPSGRYLNLGLSLRTGRHQRAASPIDGAPAVAAGFTRLALRAPRASRVDVVGDFTNWKPIAARRAAGDAAMWFIDLRIPPGQYRYAFRIDGTTWRVPDGAAAVDDGFGGKSAWLVVSPPASSK